MGCRVPDQPAAYGFVNAAALGLREPVERTLGTSARVEYGALTQALAEDADALHSRFSDDTLRRLGAAPPRSPLREAMWSTDPDFKAFAKQELERARRLAEYSPNLDELASEVSDYRPNPGA